MVRSQTPEPAGAEQSLGDLVALAAKDVSQLVRYEIDLAKAELRGDMRRVTRAGALGGTAGFVGCLLLVMLCFAYAYGLIAAGIWAWAAFLIVAGTLGLLGAAAVGIAALGLRGVSGLSRTRQTLNEDMAVLRRDNSHAEITAREPG